MAYQLIRHDEPLPARNIIVILFGEPGVSKTSLAFTAENPVLWAFDAKGLDRAVNRKDAIKFDNWPDVLEYLESGEIERNGYKTGIIDTGGAMLDDFMAPYIVGLNDKYGNGMGGLGLSGYGIMKDVASKFFVAAEKKGIDLIFICHSETEKEGDNFIRNPKMTGGSRDILIQKTDLVGYMEMRNNKITLEFSPTSRHAGKNCAQFPALEIPHYEKDPAKFSIFMADIIKKTKGHMQKLNEAQVKAVKMVSDYSERIVALESIAKITELIPEIEKMSPVHKTQVFSILYKKYAEIFKAENFLETVKEPKQFEELAERMKALPKDVMILLFDDFRKLIDIAGYTYDKTANAYIIKGSAIKEQTPPSAPPPAEGEKKDDPKQTPPPKETAKAKGGNKNKEAGPPFDKSIHTIEWFKEQVGKKILRNGPKGVEEITLKDEEEAEHAFAVSQNMKGLYFFSPEEQPAEASPAGATT